MKSIYELFEEIHQDSRHTLSSTTLHSLRDFICGYFRGFDVCDESCPVGEPPFSDFANWLARRLGKSVASDRGKWSQYHGGWWRLIEEQFDAGEHAFQVFFQFLTEFRSRTRVVILKTDGFVQLPDGEPPWFRVQAMVVQYSPESDYYLVLISEAGTEKFLGCYTSLELLRNSVAEQYEFCFPPVCDR